MLSEGRVKELVRDRDRCCTECGVDGEEYRQRTGMRLDVHRKTQGGYTLENCVAVCEPCHRKIQPVWGRRTAAPANGKRVGLVVDDDELHGLEMIAAELRMSVAGLCRCLVLAAIDTTGAERAGLIAAVRATANRIAADAPADKPKPGRPPKKPKGK